MNYLFRGKTIDTEEWVEGMLLTNKLGYYIITEDNPHECTQYGYIEIDSYARVHPESVGMWTGLTDKNEKKIFGALPGSKGGDLIEWSYFEDGSTFKGSVEFGQQRNESGYEVDVNLVGFYVRGFNSPGLEDYFTDIPESLEVIGNCLDNPKLMEESE